MAGARVFNTDGSVKTRYINEIANAYVMLPDGTTQRYEEYCTKCTGPLNSASAPESDVSVLFCKGAADYPFTFKSVTVHPHLVYKTVMSGRWVTVSGAQLQPSGYPDFLIYSSPSCPPSKIHELYPLPVVHSGVGPQGPGQPPPTYPFYFRTVLIESEGRYNVCVEGMMFSVFGSQLHPGPNHNSLFLHQGDGNFVPVLEVCVNYSSPGDPMSSWQPQNTCPTKRQPPLPASTQHPVAGHPPYLFLFGGMPVYGNIYYKVLVSGGWFVVQGSQLALTPDQAGIVVYKGRDRTSPLRVEKIVEVGEGQNTAYPSPRSPSHQLYTHGSPGSPSHQLYTHGSPGSPSQQYPHGSPRSPFNQQPSSYPAPLLNPYTSPYPATPQIQGCPVPQAFGEGHEKPKQAASLSPELLRKTESYSSPKSSQTAARRRSNSSSRSNKSLTQGLKSCKSRPEGSTTPTNNSPRLSAPNNKPGNISFQFKGVKVLSDRMYQVRVCDSWERVQGDQLRPAQNDPNSLIVTLSNGSVAIVGDVFLYQPERYTPAPNLTVRKVTVKPDQKYFVDLMNNAGSLIVPGSNIQRHTTTGNGMVWFNDAYHEITEIKIIMNSNTFESGEIELLRVLKGDSRERTDKSSSSEQDKSRDSAQDPAQAACSCESNTGPPCSILPIRNPSCSVHRDKVSRTRVPSVREATPDNSRTPPLQEAPSNIHRTNSHNRRKHKPNDTIDVFPSPCSKSPAGILRSTSRPASPDKHVKIVTSGEEDEERASPFSCSSSDPDPRLFKNIRILPDDQYSVLLENNTTCTVPGSSIRTKKSRKYVKVLIGNDEYKSYFIRPLTPDQGTDDDKTPDTPGFYSIYLGGTWRMVPGNNVRPSKRRPGRFVVVFDRRKYIVRAVNVVPVSIPGDSQYPRLEGDSSPACESSPARVLGTPESQTSLTTPVGGPGNVVPLCALYDKQGRLRSRYAPLLCSKREPNVLLPSERTAPDTSHVAKNLTNPPNSMHVTTLNYKTESTITNKKLTSLRRSHSGSSFSVIDSPMAQTFPKSPFNSPQRDSDSPIPMVINGTLVFPDREYDLLIDSTKRRVKGCDFKARMRGEFAVKVDGYTRTVPLDTAITPHVITPPASSYLATPTLPKSVKFSGDCGSAQCVGGGDPAPGSDTEEEHVGSYVALIKGVWVKVSSKTVRQSKTQKGYVVVKHGDAVHLLLDRDVQVLAKNEDVVTLECRLPDGRRLLRTWFVERLPTRCLDSIRSLLLQQGEDPVFVLRCPDTRNINDKEIRRVANCIRTHFESAHIVFEDDYLQLIEAGEGVQCPIWVLVKRGKRPRYYKLVEDLTEKSSYMDQSVTDNSYLHYLDAEPASLATPRNTYKSTSTSFTSVTGKSCSKKASLFSKIGKATSN